MRSAPETLPVNWRAYPGLVVLQALGGAWIAKQASLVLQIPRAIIPEEPNSLINPQHPDVTSLAIGPAEAFRLDLRFLPEPS